MFVSRRPINIIGRQIAGLCPAKYRFEMFIGLKRCLFYENTLIKNLDDKTTIILAKDDRLVPSYYICKYITAYYPQVHIEIIKGDHAAYISG